MEEDILEVPIDPKLGRILICGRIFYGLWLCTTWMTSLDV